ncbi:unnamed protein product [Vitrella brassicaformis CCMP3155]|uniref:GH15-like domain-containing protein n=1 Tax=Vitrella brassicaformis (strain CCMP3155) TaxID=1169540 RepID=A0A0G4GTW6_VITBC|nr:unnamed protein product [Vitrella brassicaformis CCMP3155]|eukprot:CEM34200.1 unnamed protein product [Vitrella brassicaformis CCMP3155]
MSSFAPGKQQTMARIMDSVYGPLTDAFPSPMPKTEAGPTSQGSQRRYLWTDAFAVCNYVSLAHRAGQEGDGQLRAMYLTMAARLIDTVHASLGTPRSEEYPMIPSEHNSPSGFKGLRIGKVDPNTDPGMRADGMYWHYVDKWLFALLRMYNESDDAKYLNAAVSIVKDIHESFVAKWRGKPVGLYWKLGVDLKTIPGAEHTAANDDALSAYIVYALIDHHYSKAIPDHQHPLKREIDELREILKDYPMPMRVSPDPLGVGLKLWKSQWLTEKEDTRHPHQSAGDTIGQLFLKGGRQIIERATDPIDEPLPFRLYGLLMGMRVAWRSDEEKRPRFSRGLHLDSVLSHWEKKETGSVASSSRNEHSCINRVMFVSAMDGLAWERRVDEPLLPVDQ